MTEIIIIDDELHCSDILSTLIKKVHPDYHIKGVFKYPVEGLAFIQENKFDLLFLDIEMPIMNGFKLLDKILPAKFDIIFTTAYDQYAIKAFQYSAINYLLKPITEKAIVSALASWEQRRLRTSDEQWKILQNVISAGADEVQDKMALPTGTGYEIVEIKNIVRCQSENSYTSFFFGDGSRTLICRTLKEVEAMLADQPFFRVHQSHLINPKFVKNISNQDGGTLVMSDDTEVPVSRRKRNHINDILDTMLRFD